MRALAIGCAALFGAAATSDYVAPSPELLARAEALHQRILTLDTHVDVGLDYATAANDPGGFTDNQVDLPKMRAGGLGAAFFIVYTPQGPLTEEGYAEARTIAETRLAGIRRMVEAYPDQIGLATMADDVVRIAASGRRVALIGMENPFPLGPSAEDATFWADAGVRYMSLTHFGHNQFGDSSNPNFAAGDEREKWGGLSEEGRALIGRLNDLGVMVDVSHAGEKTMLEAVKVSRAPVIASHSGVVAVAPSPRNLTDDQLVALRDAGGVAQMVALDAYVQATPPEMIAAREAVLAKFGLEGMSEVGSLPEAERETLRKEMTALADDLANDPATVADFVDHIEHAIKIAGVDHVGIASDFDGGGGVYGWRDASTTYAVTAEMLRREWSEGDIEKIWGGNLLRVMRAVEQAAAR
ncbi:MAG: dipeptidase [Pseudomonadota bacterium]